MVINPVLQEQAVEQRQKKPRHELLDDQRQRMYHSFEAEILAEDKLVNLSISESENSMDDYK